MPFICEKLNCLSQNLYLLDCKEDLLKGKMAFVGKKVKRPREYNEMKATKVLKKVSFYQIKTVIHSEFNYFKFIAFLSDIPLFFKQSKVQKSEVEEGISVSYSILATLRLPRNSI